MGKNLAWLGVLVFTVSWFLHVHEGLSAGSRMAGILGDVGDVFQELDKDMGRAGAPARPRLTSTEGAGYGGPPGWQAFRFAWDLLLDRRQDGPSQNETKRLLLGATALTNGVMLLAIVTMFLSLRSIPRVIGWLLLLCAGLNLGWVYLTNADVRSGLEVGYWMWVGSFALTGVAVLAAPVD